jgi:uncharacterized protein (TIGR03086 family)
MSEPALTSAEKTVDLPVSPDEAFALVTEPERLRRWKTVSARVDLRAGGEYRFTVTPGNVAAGTYREIEPGRRIVFGWGWEGSDELPPDASTVTITFEPIEGGTRLRLVHDGLTPAQAEAHGYGWSHFLGRLATLTDTGETEPDEWSAVPQPMTALNCAEVGVTLAQRLLSRVDTVQLALPTPCPDYTVGELAEHLTSSMVMMANAAGAGLEAPTGGTPETRFADAAQVAFEAWRTRGGDGTVTWGRAEVPAARAEAILAVEMLVHTWDLAQATGQALPVSDEVSEHVLGLAREVISPRARERGSYGAEVRIGADAPALARLIAFSGRAAA